MMHHIVLTSLKKAVHSLNVALATPTEGLDDLAREMRRDAIIQRFEYTYELCWKTMKRVIETTAGRSKNDDLFSMKDLYRRAFEAGFITDPLVWFSYHDARNETSHVYDEKKAQRVLAAIVQFAPDAQALLNTLEQGYVA